MTQPYAILGSTVALQYLSATTQRRPLFLQPRARETHPDAATAQPSASRGT